MWTNFDVTMQFNDRLMGSVPQSKELVRAWIESRKPSNSTFEKLQAQAADRGQQVATIDDLEQEAIDSLGEAEEQVTLGFQQTELGFYVRGGTIKAHLNTFG